LPLVEFVKINVSGEHEQPAAIGYSPLFADPANQLAKIIGVSGQT
jgi:hypothetical protein